MNNQANQPQPTSGSMNTLFNTEIRFDPLYLKTPPGVIKATVIVLNVLSFICIVSSAFRSHSRGVYFCIVSHMGLWFSLGLLLMYMYHVIEKYHHIPWLKIEMIGCLCLMVLNLIASTIAVAFIDPGYSAAGFFGYLAMVLYGIDAFLKARALRSGELAQGHRVKSQQVTATSIS